MKLPSWGTALLTVAAIFLVFTALPMLGSSLGSDTSNTSSSRDADTPPSPRPRDKDRGADAKGRASDPKERDVPSDERGDRPRGPLPKAGGSSLASLAIAVGLLGAGLALLIKIGFTGERPWPGRYARRID